jgi:putative two-component system response regulator
MAAYDDILAGSERMTLQAPALPGPSVAPSDPIAQEHEPTILILGSSERSRDRLREMLAGEGYRTLEAAHPEGAFELLRRETVDVVVLELLAPEGSRLDFCRAAKADRGTRFIPVLVLSSVRGAETEIAGMDSGADEFLVKPLHPEIVRGRIRAMLRHKAAIDSLEEAESILFTLAQAVEHRDHYTSGHCERLAALSMTLGLALGLSKSQLLTLHRGGYLHDIGKIAVPDSILFKPGPLTPEEWAIMRGHPVKGEEICRQARTLLPVLPIIRSHHERWDGTGYPDGLRGEQIPLLARILQTADVFDALTSARPYKPPLPPAEALRILNEEVRCGWRDPKLVGFLSEARTAPMHAPGGELIAWPPPEPMSESLESMRRAILEGAPPVVSRAEPADRSPDPTTTPG